MTATTVSIPMVQVTLTEREATLLYLILGRIKFKDAVEWANDKLTYLNGNPAWATITTLDEIEHLLSQREVLIQHQTPTINHVIRA